MPVAHLLHSWMSARSAPMRGEASYPLRIARGLSLTGLLTSRLRKPLRPSRCGLALPWESLSGHPGHAAEKVTFPGPLTTEAEAQRQWVLSPSEPESQHSTEPERIPYATHHDVWSTGSSCSCPIGLGRFSRSLVPRPRMGSASKELPSDSCP